MFQRFFNLLKLRYDEEVWDDDMEEDAWEEEGDEGFFEDEPEE
ncbi:hypothetical protein [Heyndrickxia acidiproducens]|nr:hypothetical protein [Heyndrickxia acidiproducens]